LPPYPVQNWLMGKLRPAALAAGRTDLVSLWSGQAAPLLKHRRAAPLLASLVEEAGRLLA
jgi:nitronate monooxygenase